MKNGCNDILEAKIAERNERSKKLYRYVSDVARRIDEATSASRSVSDLFSTNIEVQRQKLRDNCEKLLFLDPLNYGKKSLELLWRKVYYETVSTAKKLRETGTEYDSFLFTHIVCGIGHFHHLMSRIQSDLKVHVKELDYSPLKEDEEIKDLIGANNDEETQFGKSSLHSCLIYLGDLSRYQVEIFQSFDPSIAARYYLQAAHIDLCSGMPYNQLGNLYLDKNYNLDSVCYYIHCLSCTSPFDGALGNLMKIFEKNAQFTDTNDPETMSQAEHIQNTLAEFLSLIEIWYMSKNDTNISDRCNTIAQKLKIAMDFSRTPLPDIDKSYNEYTLALEEENNNPSFLNGTLINKIVEICLFTQAKMMETDEQKAFACKAFTLALLSQLLQKLLSHLESLGFKNPASKRPRILSQNSESEEKIQLEHIDNSTEVEIQLTNGEGKDSNQEEKDEESEHEELQNGDVKSNGKKALTKRRRRRRLLSTESSDTSNNESENSDEDTEESSEEEEDLSDANYLSDDDDSKSEGSCVEQDSEEIVEKVNGKSDDKIEIKPKNNNNNNNTINGETKTETKTELNVTNIQNFLLGDNFLASIKLLQDWALSEKDLIISCGDSGESLFQCIVDLLNIFTAYFHPKGNDTTSIKDCQVLDIAKKIATNLSLEYKTIPLPEDINLRGTNICKFDKDAAEWQILDRYNPSVYEENVIRILHFLDFGNQVAKIVPRIRFNRSMKVFYLKKTHPPKLNTKINHKKGTREWHNSKKQHNGSEGGSGGLLRRLGQLWLASRVRELEAGGAAPVLLAVDSAALLDHLRRVKQLLRAKTYVLLVPTVVLQELDELKRTRAAARDAIRWLEVQLRSGSRFLRAQRPGQARPLPLLKPPRKAPPHVHSFVQILEFCHHFTAEEGGGAAEGGSLLVLLTGAAPPGEWCAGGAAAAGVSVEHIASFAARVRRAAPASGSEG